MMTEGKYEVTVVVRLTTEQAALLDQLASGLAGNRSDAVRAYLDRVPISDVLKREVKRIEAAYTQPEASRAVIAAVA